MTILEEKLQHIYNKLVILLPQLKKICVKSIGSLPEQLSKTIIGQNKLGSYVDGSITEINDNDLKYATEIAKNAFCKYNNLTSVIIPDTVTKIGWSAFQNCTKLKNITMSKKLTEIDSFAFDGCQNLKNIIIPEETTSIGGYAFRNCSNLVEIEIPYGVTSIGSQVFYGCKSLKYLIIPDTVQTIGVNAIPSNVMVGYEQSISNNMEKYLKNNNIISFKNTLNINGSIETFEFYVRCSVTQGYLLIKGDGIMPSPDPILNLGYRWLDYCDYICKIYFEGNITSIGNKAFQNLYRVKSVVIPDSVITIHNYAFYNCTTLDNVIIPSAVRTIGEYAFYGCNYLDNLYLNSTTPPSLGNTSAIPNHTTIHVPIGSGEAYKSSTNWSYHSDRIVEDITIE